MADNVQRLSEVLARGFGRKHEVLKPDARLLFEYGSTEPTKLARVVDERASFLLLDFVL